MIITIKLFAIAQDALGHDTIELDLPEGTTSAGLKTHLAQEFPNIAPLVNSFAIAINGEYAAEDSVVNSTDEVALIPPVSGG